MVKWKLERKSRRMRKNNIPDRLTLQKLQAAYTERTHSDAEKMQNAKINIESWDLYIAHLNKYFGSCGATTRI